MHICLVIDEVIPPPLYGGAERVVYWLGRGLHELGHRVTYLARSGSRCDFAGMLVMDPRLPIDAQVPAGTDIVHSHSGTHVPHSLPFCQTIHGNTRRPCTFHPNSIFVSQRHARNHGATAFVHNGLDASDYGTPDLSHSGGNFVFLGKAAWRVKNVRGAIRVARDADARLDVLGGHRLNFSMGFRFTLDPNARFHGMVGGEEKNAYLRSARGLIFPVLWEEPFGVAVIEAFYFGLPVFATPYGALPELVNDTSGFLSNSASALAQAAARAGSYDRRAIHALWLERFTHLHMARKYLTYYERILSGESLHPGPINAPATRSRTLLAWKR
jgi:glycosyltransferase involved in cell wall biosynthesis